MDNAARGEVIRVCAVGSVLLALFLTACGSTPGASALPPLPRGAQVFASENRYEVTGTNARAISVSLRSRGSAALGGNYTGFHKWRMGWNYRYAPGRTGQCEVTEVTIELHSEISLPEWRDREVADSALVAQWDEYVRQLRAHEYGHRRYAYDGARELSRELLRVRSPDCGAISGRVNAMSRRILDKYQELNDEWDADPANRVRWPPRDEEPGRLPS